MGNFRCRAVFNMQMFHVFAKCIIFVKLCIPKLRRLSSFILWLISSMGIFEYLANLGLAAFKTWIRFLSVVK
ncbi:hypothetical protein SN4111_04050 [Ligilactobacillus agilis]|nr:hypothetical protein SN4111_04050 [Ligilactobacillus agilis]